MLLAALNQWLSGAELQPIREKLLEKLLATEPIQMVLQTADPLLQRLPWHRWSLLERYTQMELALSHPTFERPERCWQPRSTVKILAILGNSEAIDVQADRKLLEQLPNATVKFLVEPNLRDITDQLWEAGWDILFFAGHSSRPDQAGSGRIFVNPREHLTLDQLKYALRKAIEGGLVLAIFNSCDGLGLVPNLLELPIPQLIVMREPVPDRVAQAFLQYFLKAFSGGKSLYLAVREARQRLQGLENQFPCATWLPVIFQNLAEHPPTWQSLQTHGQAPLRPQLHFWQRGAMSLSITLVILLLRQVGLLQTWELNAYDQFLRLRPAERPDSRLLVVTITEADIQAQQSERPRGSLSDRSLLKVLRTIVPYQPRVIGLDVYRDFPTDLENQPLIRQLHQNQHLIAVCKTSAPELEDPGVAPPPEISPDRLGFSDFVPDADDILRRQLLTMIPAPASRCASGYAFNLQLALRYLAAMGIPPRLTPDHKLQLGSVIIQPLNPQSGGYQGLDTGGSQILLNYRSLPDPAAIAPQVTLKDLFSGQVDLQRFHNRIVLIGVTAPSPNDYWGTPYLDAKGNRLHLPGVIVQAHLVSQILSAVLDRRSLLWVWPEPLEMAWIGGWAVLTAILISGTRWRVGLLRGAIAVFSLWGLCFGLFLMGGWVPWVPAALASILTGSVVLFLANYGFHNHR
ncbi:CHASE2 domain-containing protein [Neosynechococcus sphagnicola]|uniref:CHASE2 domain-containing protein n=1 Tax=Neosynechococcus sphagnicola TaxID=1501145 RepID=UPI000A4259A8|nr:CHASE2 domain-containing protein [Neosynechococcus sphagnicola]